MKFRTFDCEFADGSPAVVKALVVGQKIEHGESGGLDIDAMFEQQIRNVSFITPPEDPAIWASTLDRCSRIRRGVHVWARSTVGLGWRIVPKDLDGNVIDIADKSNAKYREQYETEKAALAGLFKFPNPYMPFTRVAYLMKYDEEATGMGYIEVVRNNAGRIVSLYHIPSLFARVRADHEGFAQIQGLQVGVTREDGAQYTSTLLPTGGKPTVRHFKNFGDTRAMDAVTGEFRRGVARTKRATELLPFHQYTPRSAVYGVPKFISAGPAIAGNRFAAERNAHFFLNDAVPRAMLMVNGGQLTPKTLERIKGFFAAEAKGRENAGRLLILEVEPKRTGLGQVAQTSMDFKPITVGVTEDASFMAYNAMNNEEVREVLGLAEVYYRADTVNRSSGEMAALLTENLEFEPDRVEKEFFINHTIVADPSWGLRAGDGPGAEIAQFEFRRPELLDPLAKAQVRASYATLGALTANEIRAELGKDPYPDGYYFANKPMIIAIEELRAGLAFATKQDAGTGAMPPPPPGSAAAGAQKAVLPPSDYLALMRELNSDLIALRARGTEPTVEEAKPVRRSKKSK